MKESQQGRCYQRTEMAPENLDSSLGEFPSAGLLGGFAMTNVFTHFMREIAYNDSAVCSSC